MERIEDLIPKIPKLDAAPSYDDVVKMRVKSYNSMHGKLEGYDCPECLNKGYIAKIINGYEVMAECKCMKTRRTLKRIKQSGLEKQLKSCTFKNFQADSEWQRHGGRFLSHSFYNCFQLNRLDSRNYSYFR